MPTPEKLASGRWKVRYLDPHRTSPTTGRPVWSSQSFDLKRDAQQFADEIHLIGTAAALDRLFAGIDLARVPTIGTIAADHIASLSGIEPGTRLKYQRMWARIWEPRIGNTPANLLTRDHVAQAVNDLETHYAAKSIRNFHSLLSAVCNRAVDLGHMRTNVAKGTRLPRSGEADAKDMRILTFEEFAGVIERIQPEHYRPFVAFLAGTGARWGEATALQVQDVQLPNVRVRRAVKWSPDRAHQRVGPPKTKRGNRTVLLSGNLIPDIKAACAGKQGSDLVWTAPRGGPIQHRTFWSDVWLPAVQHLSPRPRIHDLRHTNASWLLAAGVSLIVVSRRLGHESVKTTGDIYGHLVPDAQVAAAAAADAAMGFAPILELD